MRHVAITIAAVTLAGLAGLLGVGCSKPADESAKKAAPTPPVDVRVDAVTSASVPRTLTLTGSVIADKSSEVAANVNGRVVVAAVERGQNVKRGDVIVRVDNDAAALSADAATAQSNASQVQVELGQKECARVESLFQKGAITASDYDRQKASCSAQGFQAQAARAQASLANKVQSDASVRAPFDGVIGERYVNVGEYVQPMTRVASLLSIDPARLSISVPESAVSLVKEGQILDVNVSAYPDRTFPATVKYVAPALRANSRDLVVEATAKNSESLLKPGMFATVRLSVGQDERPTVAAGSVRHEGGATYVFIERDGHAVQVVVRSGALTKDNRIPILSGVVVGDHVIVDPPTTLKDGAAVVVSSTSSPSSPSAPKNAQ